VHCAPLLGENTEEVVANVLGMSARELARLHNDGVVAELLENSGVGVPRIVDAHRRLSCASIENPIFDKCRFSVARRGGRD
jgi:hypothetical protein